MANNSENRIIVERLFKANYNAMLRVAAATVRDADIARDIVHDVFASLLESIEASTVDTAYLLRATRNRSLNSLRNMDRRQRIAGLYTLEMESAEDCDARQPDYAEIMLQAGEKFTPRMSEVVRLRFAEGLRYAEISCRLGISEAAVYKHLRRATEIFRNIITDNKY